MVGLFVGKRLEFWAVNGCRRGCAESSGLEMRSAPIIPGDSFGLE